jgi:hypothetical protein
MRMRVGGANMIKYASIPTQYKGVNFRSRLEAKWAVVFDQFGWEWVYEPFDLNGWTPDFMLKGVPRNILVEVKPIVFQNNVERLEYPYIPNNKLLRDTIDEINQAYSYPHSEHHAVDCMAVDTAFRASLPSCSDEEFCKAINGLIDEPMEVLILGTNTFFNGYNYSCFNCTPSLGYLRDNSDWSDLSGSDVETGGNWVIADLTQAKRKAHAICDFNAYAGDWTGRINRGPSQRI